MSTILSKEERAEALLARTAEAQERMAAAMEALVQLLTAAAILSRPGVSSGPIYRWEDHQFNGFVQKRKGPIFRAIC